MRFRKLRIAWSVFWGVASVLLIVLWVRSYYRLEWAAMFATNSTYIQVVSYHGAVGLQTINVSGRHWKFDPMFGSDSAIVKAGKSHWGPSRDGQVGFGFSRGTATTRLQFPYSFAILVSAVLWALPVWGNRRRFSLRTLLIATTLVAVVLGLIVYASRS
jgi:hypothetical protein